MVHDPAFIALGSLPRIGSKSLRALLNVFETADAVLHADEAALRTIPGIGKQLAHQIKSLKIESMEQQIQQWEAEHIRILTWDSPDYPKLLGTLPDAPPVLFMRGGWNSQDEQTIAIVGTREPTEAARQFAQLLAYKLAEVGWTVVSGLARGIDTCAHEGALSFVQNGKTVAVLGSGVKEIYPPENEYLAQRMMPNGAILSEVLPEIGLSSAQLVARNRLITGLSRAVIVVEAKENSALHAVRFAEEQKRLVWVAEFPAPGNQRLLAADRGKPLRINPTEIDETVALLTKGQL